MTPSPELRPDPAPSASPRPAAHVGVRRQGFGRRQRLWLPLLALALVVILAGCGTSRFTPKGWSGIAIDGDDLYVGSGEGRIVLLEAEEPPRVHPCHLTRLVPHCRRNTIH